jgi:adenylate cyclase
MNDAARRQVLSLPWLAIVLSLLVSAVYLFWPGPFDRLDFRVYDLKMHYRDAGSVKKAIVHLDVDDKSVREFGLWPWDRELSARIVNRLSEAGAALIVFDIVYAAQGNRPQANEALFQAVTSSGRVVSATGLGITDLADATLKDESAPSRADALYKRAWPVRLPESNKFFKVAKLSDTLVPLVPILENSKGVGHIKSTANADGVQRRVALLVRYDDKCVPSLSLATLAAYLNVKPEDVTVTNDGQISLKHPGGVLTIPVDERGRMLISWHKPWQTFAHYSVSDLLDAKADSKRLQKDYADKIVIVAVTASGTTDIGMCPLATECPLSRVHSNALNTMLTGGFIRRVSSFPFILPAAVLLSIGFAFMAPRVPILYAVLLLVGASFSYLLFSFLIFIRASYEMPTSAPMLVFVLTAAGSLIVGGMRTESEAYRASEALQRYLSPQMLDTIIKEKKEIDLATKRKELTILFADIEGFSTISETVDVEYLEKFLNEFFEAMTRSVFDHQGTVNKFLGDGLLAFFGDPVELENHALSAIKAGNQMHKEMMRLNSLWSVTGIPEFDKGIRLRVGINTGLVVVGNIGSRQRMEYTVLGSAVNVASRLQALAAPDRMLISGRTYALARDELKCSLPRKVHIKGMERDVTVYEVESITDS